MTRWLMRFALVAALAGGSAANAAKVVIITPHWEGIRYEYGRAFAAWYEAHYGEKATVEWLDQGGTSDDVKFIRSEFAGGKESIGIDLFWGGGIDPHIEFAKEGLYVPYRIDPAVLAAMPPTYCGVPMYDADLLWYGQALSGFGILVNHQVLRQMGLPTPRTWEDLGRPELAGWVGSADPRSSGSIHMMYEIILQAYGWDKGFEVIHRLGANIRAFPNSSSQTPKDVALGEAAVGMAIDQYALAQVAESGSDVMEFVMPTGQTVVNPDGIGILKGAPNLLVAQRFIDYVMSTEGQMLLLLAPGTPGGPERFALGRMSVRPDVYEQVGRKTLTKVNPFTLPASLRYDPKRGGARWALVNDLIGALVIDAHDELQAAWEACRRAGMRPDVLAQMCAMPVTEDEATRLATDVWKKADAKNVEIDRWTRFARAKYAKVLEMTGGPPRFQWLARTVRYTLPVALAIGVLALFVIDILRRFGVAVALRRADRAERP